MAASLIYGHAAPSFPRSAIGIALSLAAMEKHHEEECKRSCIILINGKIAVA